MHEVALAESIIEAALQMADKEGLKEVKEVRVRVGELQQLESDALDFAFSRLKKGKTSKALFSITMEKAELKCRKCGHVWFFSDCKLDDDEKESIHFVPEIAHTYMKCKKCSSRDFSIEKGRGIWLDCIRGSK